MDCFENDGDGDVYDHTTSDGTAYNGTHVHAHAAPVAALQQTTVTTATTTTTTTPMTMTAAAAAIHAVVTDAGSTGTDSSSSAESANENTDMNTYSTDRKDPVKRAIVFAPPSSSPKSVGTRHMETMTTTTANDNECLTKDSDDDNNHQEPFLVSVLFGQQTADVHEDHDDDNADGDEFGDMVRSWLVTVACCFVFGLLLLAAATATAAAAGTGTPVEVGAAIEMGGQHQHQHSHGQSLALAAPFFQKHHEDWTMPSMSTSGGFSASMQSSTDASQPAIL
jgi:hypothetical protein